MNSPLVSVILPVYNGEPFLHLAIESILNQTYENFEFIIINDGSTDSSWEIIQRFHEKRIRAFTQDNCNLPCTLARGLELAQGELIARLDQDDLSHPTRLDAQVRYLHEHPNVGLIGTSYQVIDQNGTIIGNRHQLTKPYHVRRHMFTGNPFAHGSVMFKRSVALQAGNFDSQAAIEDYDLWCRMIAITEMANLPDLLYCYRVNISTSMVSRNKERYAQETKRLVKELWSQTSPPNLHPMMPKEELNQGKNIFGGTHNRTRRYLYNQVGLSIVQGHLERNNVRVAFLDWIYLVRDNYRYPVHLAQILRHVPLKVKASL